MPFWDWSFGGQGDTSSTPAPASGVANPFGIQSEAGAPVENGHVSVWWLCIEAYHQFDYRRWITDVRVILAIIYLVLVQALHCRHQMAVDQKKKDTAKNRVGDIFDQIESGVESATGDHIGEENEDTASAGRIHVLFVMSTFLAVDFLLLPAFEHSTFVALSCCFVGILLRKVHLITSFFRLRAKNSVTHKLTNYVRHMAGGKTVLNCHGAFHDLGLTFFRCLIVFGVQSMMMGYYLFDLSLDVSFNAETYIFWASAIPLQFLVHDQMGREFESESAYWTYVLTELDLTKAKLKSERSGTPMIKFPSRAEIWARCLFSLISHHVYFQIILYTLPFQTMTSAKGMDFVKDAMAIIFIPNMDLYDDPKDYQVH